MPILQMGKLKHRATQAPARGPHHTYSVAESRSELRKLAATTRLFPAPTCYSAGAAPRTRLADSRGPGACRCHDNRRPMGSGQAGRGPAPPPPLAAGSRYKDPRPGRARERRRLAASGGQDPARARAAAEMCGECSAHRRGGRGGRGLRTPSISEPGPESRVPGTGGGSKWGRRLRRGSRGLGLPPCWPSHCGVKEGVASPQSATHIGEGIGPVLGPRNTEVCFLCTSCPVGKAPPKSPTKAAKCKLACSLGSGCPSGSPSPATEERRPHLLRPSGVGSGPWCAREGPVRPPRFPK